MRTIQLGRIVATPGSLAVLQHGEGPRLLLRHQSGDWGQVDEHDQAENELSLRGGRRLLSAYTTQGGAKVWIITEADRSVTTILLPDEY